MKNQLRMLLFMVFFCLLHTNALDVTPVQKVLQLLQQMLEKGKKAKHDEQVSYASAAQFCSDTKADKAASILESNGKVAALKTAIASATEKLKTLGKDIKKLDKDQDTWKGDIGASTKVRAIEKADYDEKHKAQSEAIDSAQRAVDTLKKAKKANAKTPRSFVQVSALTDLALVPDTTKKAILSFLQQGDESESQSDDETSGFLQSVESADVGLELGAEGSSTLQAVDGVIDMLEKMQDKFVGERTTLEKQEAANKQAFAMLMQDLNMQVKEAASDRSEKTVTKAKTLQLKSQKTADKKEQSKLAADDTKFLTDFTAECLEKKNAFIMLQRSRTDEVKAISTAMDIIGGDTVSAPGKKDPLNTVNLKVLVQDGDEGSSFGQLRSSMSSKAQLQAKLQSRTAMFLHGRARKMNSRVLEAVALRATAPNPMKKVSRMIKDMINKLREQASSEAGQKGFCDKELSVNKMTRTQKSTDVDKLTAEADQLQATITKTTEEITDLTAAIVGLDKGMAKQTELRVKDKAENDATVKDAVAAQAAVAQALTVLKEFYAKAGDAASGGGESGGVVAMLEVIQEDFARSEAQTKAAEDSAETSHSDFITDSKVDKSAKQASLKHKNTKSDEAQVSLQTAQKDLEGTQEELAAALRTFEKLKPTCVDAGVSYDDKVKAREEEISSLKDALAILSSDQ